MKLHTCMYLASLYENTQDNIYYISEDSSRIHRWGWRVIVTTALSKGQTKKFAGLDRKLLSMKGSVSSGKLRC